MNVIDFLAKRSQAFNLVVGLLSLFLVWSIDYLTGLEISFSIFYLLPIAVFTWTLGKWHGILMSVGSAVAWFLADLFASPSYSHPLIPYWNTTVLCGFFLIVSVILTALKRSYDFERQLAREIQEGLLPKKMPRIQGFEFSYQWRPSEAVGGDYFDLFHLSENIVVMCIGDVVGHGVPAALLMSNLQAAVKLTLLNISQPAEFCNQMDHFIADNISRGKFVTLFYCLIDNESKTLTYTNAGHNPPILVRRSGTVVRLQANGIALGLKPDWAYTQEQVDLIPGDRVVLFTDGVVECTNLMDEQFGEKRLIELLHDNRNLKADSLQNRIFKNVLKFSHGVFNDDITFVVFSYD